MTNKNSDLSIYKSKYLKYKNKYLSLKKMFGGTPLVEDYINNERYMIAHANEMINMDVFAWGWQQDSYVQNKYNLIVKISLDIVEKKIDINDKTVAEEYNKYDLLEQIKEHLAFMNKNP